MAQLSSPGVSVTVIDESFYTPAAAGTTPLIIVASAQDKANGAGTGTAPGTLKANAGQVYLLTSQKDLSDTFGTPIFKTDASNNPVHAGEQNEYGLQAAYSYLGVSNRVYAVRADIDLSELDASATAPTGPAANGTYWVDTNTTAFGIFEWNGSPGTAVNGQSFINKAPIVITDSTKVGAGNIPKKSVGAIGDYAIVALTGLLKVWFKNAAGTWVPVGNTTKDSDNAEDVNTLLPYTCWHNSWPLASSTASSVTQLASGGVAFTIQTDNGSVQTFNTLDFGGVGAPAATSLADFKSFINTGDGGDPLVPGLSADIVNGKLQFFGDGRFDKVTFGGSLFGSSGWNGIRAISYYVPDLKIQAHTQVPLYKSTDSNPRPTGSIWVKTTEPNAGAKWRVKRYNSTTALWEAISAPLYADGASAIYGLDKAGGGTNLSTGALYVKFNDSEDTGNDATPNLANFKVYRRTGIDATTITSAPITATAFADATAYTFIMSETTPGKSTLGAYVNGIWTAAGAGGYKEITVNGTGVAQDNADAFASAINDAGFANIIASVDSNKRVVISHTKAGEFRMSDPNGDDTLTKAGLVPGLSNLYATPAGDATFDSTQGGVVATLWAPLSAVNSSDAPTSLPADGRLWYNSLVDEVDIMIHDGTNWVGYRTSTSPYYNATADLKTDPNGPQVSATAPTTQSDGTALKEGDLWISTADLENYPLVYIRRNSKWALLDSADQTTENGILFHDARAGLTGGSYDPVTGIGEAPAGTIVELLDSNFVDFDAPDPALYPKGMLLWNLRRSGFNVKAFTENYIDVTADNLRYLDQPMGGVGNPGDPGYEPQYYPHRWVSAAANNEDGSGAFGRHAQRKVVVQALQALVNSNQQIRDEEARVFSLIATPGYPELIGEMISLNYDRGLTAFVVGDTPARLKSDATTLVNWGTNQALALEDNDSGLVSSDEYLGIFYPWGYTSDNIGNNVVVPPSHMILRTIALSDNVSYPWFAPAGTRRGCITNATAVGYVDATSGEFQSVALNTGQRDTLASIKVNPITFITGTGLVNYGQYTRAKNASALDRINVARLVVYLRRQLSILAKPYVFEPNDKITRDEIKQAAESLMLELVGQRALYDYIVVCDTSNNTPSRIDRNELYLDIAIEPVKAVEFIYIPLRLKNTGEIKGLG
jgi:hypothetical protein